MPECALQIPSEEVLFWLWMAISCPQGSTPAFMQPTIFTMVYRLKATCPWLYL